MCTRVCACVCAHVCVCVCACVHMCACMCVHLCVCMFAYSYMQEKKRQIDAERVRDDTYNLFDAGIWCFLYFCLS